MIGETYVGVMSADLDAHPASAAASKSTDTLCMTMPPALIALLAARDRLLKAQRPRVSSGNLARRGRDMSWEVFRWRRRTTLILE